MENNENRPAEASNPAVGTGQPEAAGPTALPDKVRESLKTVTDPEIGFNIVDLGLVYKIEIDDEANARVAMTLTSPGCPVGPEILAAAHMATLNTDGVKNAKIDLVWDPPWDPRVMASEDVKLEFGLL